MLSTLKATTGITNGNNICNHGRWWWCGNVVEHTGVNGNGGSNSVFSTITSVVVVLADKMITMAVMVVLVVEVAVDVRLNIKADLVMHISALKAIMVVMVLQIAN